MTQGTMSRVESTVYEARRERTSPERDETYRVTRAYTPGLYTERTRDQQYSVWDGRYVVKPYGPGAGCGWYQGAVLVGYVVKKGTKWVAYTPEGNDVGVYTTRAKAADAAWSADRAR